MIKRAIVKSPLKDTALNTKDSFVIEKMYRELIVPEKKKIWWFR